MGRPHKNLGWRSESGIGTEFSMFDLLHVREPDRPSKT